MKLTHRNYGDSLELMSSEPGRWDGVPLLNRFVLDFQPRYVTNDRLAVAFILLFGSYLGGSVNLPGKINIVTASAIEEFLNPTKIYFPEVEDAPAVVETGSATLVARNGISGIGSPIAGDKRKLQLLDRADYLGHLRSHRSIAVSSNGAAFDSLVDYPAGLIASSVLIAADFGAGAIEVELDQPCASYLRLYGLLNSVGLKLKC